MIVNEIKSLNTFKERFPSYYEELGIDSLDVSKNVADKIQSFKNTLVRGQKYEEAAALRDFERDLIEILNDDKVIHVNLNNTTEVL